MGNPKRIAAWKWIKDCNLDGYSVIVVCVSVGNVPQLTGDLLISSLGMERAASIFSPALVPICGADPYNLNSSQLCGASDFYITLSGSKTAIVQIRSAVVRSFATEFLNELVDTLKEKSAKEIIILSSSYAHEKHQVLSSSYRYFKNVHYDKEVDGAWSQHEKNDDKWVVHGGGFASKLLEVCTEKSMPGLVLFKYCSEGDNIPDATENVAMLSKVVSLIPEGSGSFDLHLKQPVSWRLMFGGPPPTEIY